MANTTYTATIDDATADFIRGYCNGATLPDDVPELIISLARRGILKADRPQLMEAAVSIAVLRVAAFREGLERGGEIMEGE